MSKLLNTDLKSVKVLVSSGNQAFASAAGGIYPSSGNSHQVADGQLAMVSWDDDGFVGKGLFLTATNGPGAAPNEYDDVRYIRLVQGTSVSTDISGLNQYAGAYGDQNIVMSDVIDGRADITLIGEVQATGSRSAYVLGNNDFLTDDSSLSTINITFESRQRVQYFGAQIKDGVKISVQTPVFADISLTTDVQKRDWINQHFVYKMDGLSRYHQRGRKPFVAFAIDIDGGGTGTALSAITAGVPFNYITRNGTTYSYTPDTEFVNTITNVIANTALLVTSEIGVVDLSTAGAQQHDAILIVALDETNAVATDRMQPKRVLLTPSYTDFLYNYGVTTLAEGSTPVDNTGEGRFWNIEYSKLADKQIWNQNWFKLNELSDLISQNPVSTATNYNVYLIQSYAEIATSHYHVERTPSLTILLVPATAGASEANTLTSLNGVLSPWLESCPSVIRTEMPSAAPGLFV